MYHFSPVRSFAVVVVTLLVTGSAGADYVPGTYAGTGPYRRVYSRSAYSFMTASVTLPGGSLVHATGTDTPYVYTGGWGTGGATAVDAGFQYSPTFNNWSLFLKVEGFPLASDALPRFKASQTVTLQFDEKTVGSTATLEIIADGIDINNSAAHRVLTVTGVPNWSGGADTLKRMTSIAQAGGDHLYDGSFISGVHWFNTTIGTSAADAQPWLAGQTGGYESYTPAAVSVQFVSAGEETDGISLTPEPGGVACGALAAGALFRRRRKTA